MKVLGLDAPPDHLPLLDANSSPRQVEAIVQRAAALSAVAAVAYGYPRDHAARWLSHQSVELAPSEAQLLATGEVSDEQGRPEGLFVLAWAASLVHQQPQFDSHCPEDLVREVPRPPRQQDEDGVGVSDVLARASARPTADVVQLLDTLYCVHWATVDAGLNGRRLPTVLPLWVIAERRRAAEWLVYDHAWDEIDLST